MGDVIQQEKYLTHEVCEVIDIACGHRWIAAFPLHTALKELECPKCGKVGTVIKTGQTMSGSDIGNRCYPRVSVLDFRAATERGDG